MPRTMKQNDTFPPLTAVLKDEDNIPIDLTSAVSVRVWLRSSDLAIETDPCTIADAVNGLITYTFNQGDTAVAGEYRVEYQIDWGPDNGKDRVQTVPNDSYDTLTIIEELDPN